MEITEVKVFPVQEEKLKAFVSIVFEGCFMVNDIKIIQGRGGRFISMPSRRKKNGEFKDVAHPLNNATRQRIEKLILSEYDRIVSGAPAADQPERQAASETPTPARRVVEPKTQETNDEGREQTLEEVTEVHLRDSFWTR